MASYSIASGERAAHAKTLVGSTVDTVTFAYHAPEVEVVSLDGAAAIYFTADGSTPTVGGVATYVVPAAIGSRTVRLPLGAGVTVVKIISSGTPIYSVQS